MSRHLALSLLTLAACSSPPPLPPSPPPAAPSAAALLVATDPPPLYVAAEPSPVSPPSPPAVVAEPQVTCPPESPAPNYPRGAILQITEGYDAQCALFAAQTVWCWGINGDARLGEGTTKDRAVPAPVHDLARAVSLAFVNAHGCSLLQDHRVKCWGNNFNGELGDGTDTNRRPSAGFVTGLRQVREVAVGDGTSCALLHDGTVRCWGEGINGTMGNGTRTRATSLPQPVLGLAGVASLALGRQHACALTQSHDVFCWGLNDHGQLGDGTQVTRTRPVPVPGASGAVELVAGGDHTCARWSDGSARCWGENTDGQLGDGSHIDRWTPALVAGPSCATQLTAGLHHTCARWSDGSARCWGSDVFRQLGANLLGGAHPAPVRVDRVDQVVSISAGALATCALLLDGGVGCWGEKHGTLSRWTDQLVPRP